MQIISPFHYNNKIGRNKSLAPKSTSLRLENTTVWLEKYSFKNSPVRYQIFEFVRSEMLMYIMLSIQWK